MLTHVVPFNSRLERQQIIYATVQFISVNVPSILIYDYMSVHNIKFITNIHYAVSYNSKAGDISIIKYANYGMVYPINRDVN